ncbi:MAG TPA: GxxExxY protein, partial [Desulfuromonadaceae bacterium]|nr:GxxExxY protein [Desulfuromonadaceae bacterium]
DGKVLADPKVVTAFNETHVARMIGYLNITGLEVALLLNFKNSKLDWKRVANERRKKASEGIEFVVFGPPSASSAVKQSRPNL